MHKYFGPYPYLKSFLRLQRLAFRANLAINLYLFARSIRNKSPLSKKIFTSSWAGSSSKLTEKSTSPPPPPPPNHTHHRSLVGCVCLCPTKRHWANMGFCFHCLQRNANMETNQKNNSLSTVYEASIESKVC